MPKRPQSGRGYTVIELALLALGVLVVLAIAAYEFLRAYLDKDRWP